MSHVFPQVMLQLHIKHQTSSAYHPPFNGPMGAARFVCLCSHRPGPTCSRIGVCPHTGRVPVNRIKVGLAPRNAAGDLICVVLYECQDQFDSCFSRN